MKSDEIEKLLSDASETQIRWVAARIQHTKAKDAAAALGIDRTACYQWDNRDRLEQAIKLALVARVQALASGVDLAQAQQGENHVHTHD